MTVKQPLFQQNDTTDQAADIGRLLVRDVVNERGGIVQEAAFEVRQRAAGANNSVDIQAGGLIVPGTEGTAQGYYYCVNDGVLNVPMSTAAHGSLARIDSLVLEVRDGFYSGTNNDARVVYQAGTASSSPVAPDLTALGYKNYWRLANITVPANDNTITTGDISDQRAPSGARATAVGGTITCTSTTRPTLPRPGQQIFEIDTNRHLLNEATAAAPLWRRVGTNIITQQKLITNSSTFSADANSDMVLNNVSVLADHTYAIHLHADVEWSSTDADVRWVVRLRVNGVDNAVFADMLPRITGVAQIQLSSTVYWVAPSTQASDDFLVRLDEAVTGGTFMFQASTSNPRWLTFIDMGVS
jgi:hypothetical protein